jgi:hypothetical protein
MARHSSPHVGSVVQTIGALIVLAIFAGLGLDPILNMFTWISQVGTLGVIGMMTVTSLGDRLLPARAAGRKPCRRLILPAVSGLIMAALFVYIFLNFGDPDRHHAWRRAGLDPARHHPGGGGCNGGQGRGDPRLAHAAHAVGVAGVRDLDDHRVDHRQVAGDRDAVIEEHRVLQPPIGAVDIFLVQRPADALRRAALVLALDIGRMDRRARVLHHQIAQHRGAPVSGSTSTSTTWVPKLAP